MNNWSDYELLFEILVISINVLWYSAIVAGVVEKILDVRKGKVREVKNDKTKKKQEKSTKII